jgi:hypothetical protein
MFNQQPRQRRNAAFLVGFLCIGTIVGLNNMPAASSGSSEKSAPPAVPVAKSKGADAKRAAELQAYRQKRVDYTTNPKAADAHVDKLARQTGGDFNQLSKEDQSFLNGMTSGHGYHLLHARAKRLNVLKPNLPDPAVARYSK